jgi:hypothetical protein
MQKHSHATTQRRDVKTKIFQVKAFRCVVASLRETKGFGSG